MTFYFFATGICIAIGTVILLLTNDLLTFYFYAGAGFLWFMLGCVVTDIKEAIVEGLQARISE